MDDFNDSTEMTTSIAVVKDKPYRTHAKVAWILMTIVAVIALVPVLGFASWFIAGPMLLISFILIVLVFVKGGVAHGLTLLTCQIIMMPIIVIFGPMVTSALGLLGAAADVGASLEGASIPAAGMPSGYDSYVPSDSSESQQASEPVDAIRQPVILPSELQDLKRKLNEQQYNVSTWIRTGIASETSTGFLKSGESADIETRKSVQQQNLWREQVFAQISELTRQSTDEVARTYARLASKQ